MEFDHHSGLTSAPKPRLLFVDAYDSFSNNIISLLRLQLSADVTTIRIDDPRFQDDVSNAAFRAFLRPFDAVVVGPGPGDPRRPEDVGVIEQLWSLPQQHLIPVLGVCLGFQSLVLAFGGLVARLSEPRHGLIKDVVHSGQSLFDGVGEVRATQYHSWHAQLGHVTDDVESTSLWRPSTFAPQLCPLAWDLSDCQNGPVLMAVRHINKPFFGVQYHPESVCTNAAGAQIIQNWWQEVQAWSCIRKKSKRRFDAGEGLDSGYGTETDTKASSPDPDNYQPQRPVKCARTESPTLPSAGHAQKQSQKRSVTWTSLDIPQDADLIPVFSRLIEDKTGHQPVLLESGTKQGKPVRAETGRFSVLCFIEADRHIFQYWTDRQCFEVISGDDVVETHVSNVADSFDHIKAWLSKQEMIGGPSSVPFWGGLVGLISYEAGLETISVQPVAADELGPDICFVSVQRSFVIDHVDKKVYVQSLKQFDDEWVEEMSQRLARIAAETSNQDASRQELAPLWRSTIHRPDQASYCQKVEACQSYIRAGDSYELCLTERSAVDFCNDDMYSTPSPLAIYGRLRRTNPAPFGAFISLNNFSLMSSSPERFLSWSRDGLCEFRPIKGTVQKQPGVTRAAAEAILKTDKEQAENLMIVDLIRHDLNGVVGLSGGSALAPKLMQVEEYETVYQLVSVIRGQLNAATRLSDTLNRNDGEENPETPQKISFEGQKPYIKSTDMQHGIDVLAASLPPGSMTGAPKKRSCELLKAIENRRRGAYSGVLGYFDVGGGGDFSVVIRSVIKDQRGYSIAAGGAVTALSDPFGEWQEMMAKSTAVQI